MTPMVKYLGGKRRIASQIAEHFPSFARYIEPFVGAGGMFCHVKDAGLVEDKPVFLSDYSDPIITLYAHTREPHLFNKLTKELIGMQSEYDNSTPHQRGRMFTKHRDAWNKGERTPSRYIFLKQTAFNGLWRVNKSDGHNAPWGKYTKAKLYDEQTFTAWHEALQSVHTKHCSFQDIEPKYGDLVYVDPPYYATFSSYTKDGFPHATTVNLLCHAKRWRSTGASVIISNSCDPTYLDLVELICPTATIHEIGLQYSIAQQRLQKTNESLVIL